MSARKIVRSIRKMTRQSGLSSLLGGPGMLKRGIHKSNRKKLATHFKRMRFAYSPKAYERYRRDK